MAGEDVQKIKDTLSIADVVGQYVQLKKAGKNMTGRCPFHTEKTPSFFVSPERGTYICFGCGEKGDIFSFIEKMEGIDFSAALKQLAERAGVTLDTRRFVPKAPEETQREDRLRDICEAASAFFEAQLRTHAEALAYVQNRGVSDDTRADWRIGYAPAQWEALSAHLIEKGFSQADIVDAGLAVKSEKKPGAIFDRFRGRIMFPLFDAGGKVIAFSGRFFEKVAGSKDDGGEPAKYINSPETPIFRKSRVLYGFDRAKQAMRKADCALLVEGQFDVVLAHQSGLPFTVAVSGTAFTPEHLSLLSRLTKRLVLALDADAAGIRAGFKTAHMLLSAGFDVKVPRFPAGKDPADLARENPELLKAAVRTSVSAIEFFLEALRLQAKDERAYKLLVERDLLPLVAAIESSIEQEHFARIIAERLRVSEDAVRAELRKRMSGIPSDVLSKEPAADTTSAAPLSALERSAGLLLSHWDKDSEVGKRLTELIGDEEVSRIGKKISDIADRLQFEFDALGDDEAVSTGLLLSAVERAHVDEELVAVRRALRSAEHGGELAQAKELAHRLSYLAKRRQELRLQ